MPKTSKIICAHKWVISDITTMNARIFSKSEESQERPSGHMNFFDGASSRWTEWSAWRGIGSWHLLSPILGVQKVISDTKGVHFGLSLGCAPGMQVPALLLRNLWRGTPWQKVDLCTGKLVELGGD